VGSFYRIGLFTVKEKGERTLAARVGRVYLYAR